MPHIEQTLTAMYRGRTFDVAKASENENWFDQGWPRPRRASGLPLKTRLWLYSFVPQHGCCDRQLEFGLARMAAEDGGGFRYAPPMVRLQVETDGAGLITGALLKPALGDRLPEKPLELPGKPIDGVRRGHVRAALGLPTESSQRPDLDRLAYAHHEVRFSYGQRSGAVTDVRISRVHATC